MILMIVVQCGRRPILGYEFEDQLYLVYVILKESISSVLEKTWNEWNII